MQPVYPGPILRLLHGRPGGVKRLGRAALWLLLLFYLAALLRITVFRPGFGTHPLLRDGQILWVPFVSLYRIFRNSLSRFLYLFLGNLVWFVPLGLLAPALTGMGRRVIPLGLGLSTVIECCQFVFGTGVSEVEDLILNTLGTAMGYGLFLLLRKIKNPR